jgi:hypothetical protein
MATALVAAIVYDAGQTADGSMLALAAECRALGITITGLVQHNEGECAAPGFFMALEDLASGRRISLTAPKMVHGCRMDMAGLAEAATTLRPERHLGSDCVVINKFGRQEAIGRGLRSEMAELIMEGVPVLTSIRRDFIPAFEAFAGPDWLEMKPEAQAVSDWLAALHQEGAVHAMALGDLADAEGR